PAPAGQGPPAPGRPSDCEPWRATIQAKLDLGLSAQRIHQDLVSEHGFTGSYYSVRRFVRHLEATLELPFRRLECGPGEEAQVDFGCGAPLLLPDGRRRRTHVFRIVLSHSRKAYSEAVLRQTTDDFLRCLENALWHFGGVPQRLVLDNLRAAVARLDWERTVADTRIHGTTRRQVGTHFLTIERPALQRLPLERFPCFQEARRVVHRDGHVEVERAYYSVPPEYLARPVWARWDGRLVRIFNDKLEQIAVHVRHEPGRFSTQSQHISGPKISGVERGAAWLLGQVRRLGPCSLRWAEAMLLTRGVEGVRVLQGLLN